MIKTVLSWFRPAAPESPAVTFARRVGHVLEWWLIGFGDAGVAAATNVRVLEAALGLYEKDPSVRHGAAWLANVLVGDIILAFPADVRSEVLNHMGDPEINNQLLTMRSTDVMMLPDTMYGFATEDARLNTALRVKMKLSVVEGVSAPGLSAEARALFAAVRHLWARAIVAVQMESGNDGLKARVRRLMSETIYALQGDDSNTRQKRHVTDLLEQALFPESPENGDSV